MNYNAGVGIAVSTILFMLKFPLKFNRWHEIVSAGVGDEVGMISNAKVRVCKISDGAVSMRVGSNF